MCLRGAQSRAQAPVDVSTIYDCATGAVAATSKTHTATGGPDAAKFEIKITGKASPYDIAISSKAPADKFVEAYVGVFVEGKPDMLVDGLAATAPAMTGTCTVGGKPHMIAHVSAPAGITTMAMKFTPEPDFAKSGDQKIIAKGFVCAVKGADTTPCSGPIMSPPFMIAKGSKGPSPGGPPPGGPPPPDGGPGSSSPQGSEKSTAFHWKATNTLSTAFMVPALVTLLIIIALKQFPVFPYAFITMY
ncbi:hypothetical protein HPB50_016134 [Hyalomma asiaticum]|uniref:Uncharacterized protein n=1 Tax=Hyalomma asiaticum TaxID=266040 RepID=A0ACB7SNM0_HYAAI|nr:hypothetical protein HPB50_016134 [Hyalomma asiaticum]